MVYFAVAVDHKVKTNGNLYWHLSRELRTIYNMRVMVIPIVFRTIPKSFLRGLEELKIGGQAVAIRTTTLL